MVILLLPILVMLFTSCGIDEEKVDTNTKSESDTGKALFIRNGCAVCHGDSGRGDGPVASSLSPPPRNFSDSLSYKEGSSVDQIAETIKRGVGKSAMPAYPHLLAEDRRLIAVYIASLQIKP